MSSVSSFAGNSLLHQGGGFEPQRKSNFALVISGLDETDKLVLTTKSVKIPGVHMAQGGIKHFNETMHYAGSVQKFGPGSIVFRDFIDVDTGKILSKWYKQVICFKTGAIGWARDYKKQGDLYLLPPGMPAAACAGEVFPQEFQGRSWKLQGIWPMGLDYDELDHDDEGTVPAGITLEISVDRAYPTSMMD